MKRWGWALAVTALVSLGLAPVLRADIAPGPGPRPHADVAPGPGAGPHPGRRPERPEQRLDRLQRHAAALASSLASAVPSGSAVPLPSGSAAPALREQLAQRLASLRATRAERRERHRAALLREVGAKVNAPQVQAELGVHAKRLAELSRLEFLAQNARSGEAREKLLGRVRKLSAREAERHRVRLAHLLSPAPAPSSAPSAAAPLPSGTPTP